MYYVIPRTSGLGFQRPIDAIKEGKNSILNKNGGLTDLAENTLKDIFKRLSDIEGLTVMDCDAFNSFYTKSGLGEAKSSDFFKFNVLKENSHTSDNQLDLRGFLDWFTKWTVGNGQARAL
jgi:hypothetical protein